jgi:hypothetical protein
VSGREAPGRQGPTRSIRARQTRSPCTSPARDRVVEFPTTDAHSFTAAIRHIHAVLRGAEAPRLTADASALANGRLLEAAQTACRTGD